jgi:tripartite-type tricarboxylate transporter receptor subunit TctC
MQKVFRRLFASVLCVWSATVVNLANSQEYPSRPIKLVIPQAPGSGADLVGRMLAEHMSKSLKQSVVVDNKPGANGIIASQLVQREQPDGYTLMLTSVSLVSFNQFLYKNVPFDPLKDFTFISPVADAGFVLVASVNSGIKSWNDLIKKAKAEPDVVKFASAGVGNSTHLYSEMIGLRSGIKIRHIPYKSSGPALMAVVAGEADLMTVTTATGLSQIKGGKVIALAQSGESRSSQLAEVPLLKELAPNMPALPGWYALIGPAKMDAAVTKKISAAVNQFLTDPPIAQKLNDQFLFPIPGTPADIQKRAESEARVWGGLIGDLKLQID